MSESLREIDLLLHRFCEEELTPEEYERLVGLLRQDAKARRRYVHYLDMHASLSIIRAGQVGVLKPMSGASLRGAPRLGILRSSLTAWLDWRSHPLLFSAAMLFLTGWIGLWLISVVSISQGPRLGRPLSVNRPRESATTDPNQVVGRLTAAHHCQWSSDAGATVLSVGTRLAAHQVLDLTRGTAEITFRDGAVVLLEGPARFVTASVGAGQLIQGSLVAHVPADAVGFTLQTPRAAFVDLGTEFGLIVANNGATEAHVFAGLVEVRAADDQPNGSTEPKTARLSAGQSLQIASNGEIQYTSDLDLSQMQRNRQRLRHLQHPAPLLVNGGFEGYSGGGSGLAAAPSNHDLLQKLTPASWRSIPGNQVQFCNVAEGLWPRSGQAMIGIFGNVRTANNAGISQTFDTLSGGEYKVSFSLARQTSAAAPTVTVDLFDATANAQPPHPGGGELLSERIRITVEKNAWQDHAFFFTATSDRTTLRLLDTGDSLGVDPFIDRVDVRLQRATPPPFARSHDEGAE